MLDDGSPFRLDNIPVSKDFLTPEVYERINQGELVHWEFSMLRKGSKMESIILKNVMLVSDYSQSSDD